MSARSRAPSPFTLETEGAERPRAGGALGKRIPILIEKWREARKLSTRGAPRPDEIRTAGKALLRLQRGLTGERDLVGERYMDDADLLGAYLLYYWPVSYMQASLALTQLPAVPRRVLDLGSGPGPFSAAALDAQVGGPGIEELVLVDSSPKALELASSLLEHEPRPTSKDKKPRIVTLPLDLESKEALPEGPFDLIMMGHCLNELWRGQPGAVERRLDLVKRARGSLSPGGAILLVEPALLLTSRELIALRDRLIQEGFVVRSPCPGSYPCPAIAAGPERSCHAESSWALPELLASLAASAGLDRDSVKFAYFIIMSSETEPADPDKSAAKGIRRVVSDPMLNKAGRIRYILCGDGKLETLSARADDETARRSGFMSLKRGDILRPAHLEERPGGGYGLSSASTLEILSRAPEAGE